MSFSNFLLENNYISELGMYHVNEYRERTLKVNKPEYRTVPNCLILLSAVSESVAVSLYNDYLGKKEYVSTSAYTRAEHLFKMLSPADMLDTKCVILSVDPKLRKIIVGTCAQNENQVIKARTIISQIFSSFTTEVVKILEIPYLIWVKDAHVFNKLEFEPRELKVSVDEKLKTIFRVAVEKRAADISFESFKEGTYAKFKIDQEWQRFRTHTFIENEVKELDNRLLSMCEVATTALAKKTIDGALKNLGYVTTHRGRLNRIKSNYGIVTNIRVLPNEPKFIDLDTLNYSPFVHEYLRYLTKPRKGLVLLLGETNSGKNTAVFSVLSEINKKHELKVISVEAPIEYLVPGVNQLEARDDEDYADIVRAVVRQSPDIFYISEIRDFITMDASTTLANQGKFTISTMHLSHAYQLFNRAEDIVGKDISNKLSTELIGVINQKLMPKSCPDCQIKLTKEQLAKTDADIVQILEDHLYTGPIYGNTGRTKNKDVCARCGGQGTFELVPIAEYIHFDDKLKRDLRRCQDLSTKEELLYDKMLATKNTLAEDSLRQMSRGNLNIHTIINKAVLNSEFDA